MATNVVNVSRQYKRIFDLNLHRNIMYHIILFRTNDEVATLTISRRDLGTGPRAIVNDRLNARSRIALYPIVAFWRKSKGESFVFPGEALLRVTPPSCHQLIDKRSKQRS